MEKAKTFSRSSQTLMSVMIVASALLAYAFIREGKIGSALLSLNTALGLVDLRFGVLDKVQSLENKSFSKLIVASWFATTAVMLGISLLSVFFGTG